MEDALPAPNVPDDLTPLELARRVFDAWRAAAPEPRAELPAPLVQIARALLVCCDADRIAAVLDVPRHVLLDVDAAPGAPATTSPTSFVALPATGTSDVVAAVVEPDRRARRRVLRRHRHPRSRTGSRAHDRRPGARAARRGGAPAVILLTHDTPILLGVAPADFRKGIDGFQQLCRAALGEDPESGTVYVFVNRARTMIRALTHDGSWLLADDQAAVEGPGDRLADERRGRLADLCPRASRAAARRALAAGRDAPGRHGRHGRRRPCTGRVSRHTTPVVLLTPPPAAPSAVSVASRSKPAAAEPRFADIAEHELDALIGRVEEARDHGLALSAVDLGLLLNALLTLANVAERLEHDDLTIARMRKLLGIVRSSEKLRDLTGVRDAEAGDDAANADGRGPTAAATPRPTTA